MISRKLLPVLVLSLAILAGCIAPASPATPPLPIGTSTGPATAVVVDTATPIPTGTAVPIPPGLPVVAAPALVRIDFQDANNGWGIAVNPNGYVLRTVDGGQTWLDASPPGIGGLGLSANLVVLNTNTVWVLVPGTDFFSGTLYHTGDGGIHWSSNTVPFGGALIQFQDGRTGRLLAERGAGAGSEAVELLQTSDGGVTWNSVFHDDPGQSGSSDSLPLAGIKNGLTFTDSLTGWVTGSLPADGEVYLYITRDGGASWTRQNIPLPAAYQAYRYMAQAPVFFGKDGFLPVTIYLPDRTLLTFYTSHDGGATWSGDPSDSGSDIKPGLYAFTDASHGYAWDGGSASYITRDGAQTWTEVATNLDLRGQLAQLEFAPDPGTIPVGWALTRLDEAGHSQLYRTTDGTHWTPLNP